MLHNQTASFKLVIGSLRNIAAVEVFGAGGRWYLIPPVLGQKLFTIYPLVTHLTLGNYLACHKWINVGTASLTLGIFQLQCFTTRRSLVCSLHANCCKIGWLALHATPYIDNLWSQLQTECYCNNFIHHIFYLLCSKFLLNIIAMSLTEREVFVTKINCGCYLQLLFCQLPYMFDQNSKPSCYTGITLWLSHRIIINPFRSDFFQSEQKHIYLHAMSFFYIDMTQVVSSSKTTTYLHYIVISWVLICWRRKEWVHQQPWYWLCWTKWIGSSHVKG